MNKNSPTRTVLLCATSAATLAIIGCANLEIPDAPVEDIAPQRAERLDNGVTAFKQQHDDAQFKAAMSAWQNGDPAGCQGLLEKLLARSPEHFAARSLLADLYLENSQLEMAERHLLTLLEQDPNVAQVHHSLGLLFEELGQSENSLFHLQRAVELAPGNQIYAETLALFTA